MSSLKERLKRFDAHQIQALASVALVLLTFSYLVATIFLVRASNRMARASDENAQNALESLRAARAEFASSHRPYLSFAFDDSGDKAIQAAPSTESYLLPVKATDFGEFPAYHVNLWARIVVSDREIFSSKESGIEQMLFPKETQRFRMPIPGAALLALSKAPHDGRSFLEFRADYSGSPSAATAYSFRERGDPAFGRSFLFKELGRWAD